MIRRIVILGGLIVGLGLVAVASPPALAGDRVWFGGGFSLGFGDVDYVSVEPMAGVRLTQKLSVGASLIYRYRKDSRYSSSLGTTDYGASVFARYRIRSPVFVHAEIERLSYEFPFLGGSEREEFDSVLGGVGFAAPMVGRTSFFALALYNFSYDSGELRSPYSEPWVFRAGVTFGF